MKAKIVKKEGVRRCPRIEECKECFMDTSKLPRDWLRDMELPTESEKN